MTKILITMLAAALLTALPFASAAIVGGGVTVGDNVTGVSSTAQQANITGGNISAVNVTGTSITANWGGFFGQVTGGISLEDASGNQFYSWSLSNYTGAIVYATNLSTTFGAVIAANNSHVGSNINSSGTDNFTNTYSQNQTFDASSTIGSISEVRYVNTTQNGGADKLQSFALYDTGDTTLIFAGVATDDTESFQGNAVDYQILVPAGSGVDTYFFYLELP